MLTLLARLNALPSDAGGPAGISPAALARIEARLQDLESGPPSLAALAKELDLSPRHLTRVFKAATGQTISQRFRDLQLERAADLLATDRSLVEIALACGFRAQSHFTTAYRTRFGCPPGRDRRVRVQRPGPQPR